MSEILTQEEMRLLAANAFRHLPQAERNVLRRRFGIHAPGEAWSHARIAGDLGLTVPQVRNLEEAGLRRLRSLKHRGLVGAYVLPAEPDTTTTTTEGDAHEPGADARPAE